MLRSLAVLYLSKVPEAYIRDISGRHLMETVKAKEVTPLRFLETL